LVTQRQKEISDFESSLGSLGLFLTSHAVLNTVRSVKINDSRTTTRDKHVDTAVQWAVSNDGRSMSRVDKTNLTAAFVLVKQNKNWMHGVAPPDKLREQTAYTAMNKFVKELSDIVDYYRENQEYAHFGSVSYSFIQKLYYAAVYGSTIDIEDDGKLEFVWMRRLSPIISHHIVQALMSTLFNYGSLRGPSHPDWIIQRNDAILMEYFEVKEAGEPFVQPGGRKMLTLFAKKDNLRNSLNILYTGILCTTMRHQNGRFEKVAVGVPLETSFWIIPPPEFDIDSAAFIHPAHLIHQEQSVAHFEFYDYGDRSIFMRQIRPFKAGQRLFCYYGSIFFKDGEFIKIPPEVVVVNEGEPKKKRGRGEKLAPGSADAVDEGIPKQKRVRKKKTAADSVAAGVDVAPSDEPARFTRAGGLRVRGTEKSADAINKLVEFVFEELDDESDQKKPDNIIFKSVDIKRTEWEENMKTWEVDARQTAKSQVSVSLDYEPTIYRHKLARNSFLDLPISGLNEELDRMVYEDLYKHPKPEDLVEFDWISMFVQILKLHALNPLILQLGNWEYEDERSPQIRLGFGLRWVGDYTNFNFFAKYVSLLNAVVNDLHGALFPSKNKKFGALTSPNLFLSDCDAASDKEPKCFSTCNDLTYMFFFPGDPKCEPLELGLWKESVATICAMQGALERASHIPKILTKSLKEQPMKMNKIQVGLDNLIVMDSRLLNVRIQSNSPTLCVLWTASSKSKQTCTNDLVMHVKDNVIVLKPLFKKYFCQGIYTLLFHF
jgi:hypothetical protein